MSFTHNKIPFGPYVKALIRGKEKESGEVVQQALAAGWTIEQVYSTILAPAHAEIDRLNAEGLVNRAHHHLATQLMLSHMETVRSRQHSRPHGRRAIVAVAQRGDYSIYAMMITDVLRSDGWAVDDLGSFVPLKDLVQLLQERAPDLLAITVTPETKSQTIKRIEKAVRSLAQPPQILLARTVPAPGKKLETADVQVAQNLEELPKLARASHHACAHDLGLSHFLETLGSRIRAARLDSSMTQQQLAEKANLDRTYIIAVEQGRQNVTVGAVMRIAEALQLSIDHLLVSER